MCPVSNWCVCQWAFEGYIAKAGGCDAIQDIMCDAVNIVALKAYAADPKEHGMALACLKEKCKLPQDSWWSPDIIWVATYLGYGRDLHNGGKLWSWAQVQSNIRSS